MEYGGSSGWIAIFTPTSSQTGNHRLQKINQVLPQLLIIHRAIFGKQGLHLRQPFRLPARQGEAV
ncbi:Uncharacterised protein [Klebsiella pneumoniae]|uniref:Uncharacterized protein n=1 Tax=Klebsiella pneumoniae TaxID=573 RepID=A0A447RSP6_KLEPN|nr:Uncharacterised protein [Klebsiella pneumoniae]